MELTDRRIVMVEGPERLSFLDGILTCRTADLEPGALVYGALLSPQGKVQTDLFIHAEAERLALDLPQSVAEETLRRLTMYKLRAAVTFTASDAAVLVGEGPADPRAEGLGGRRIGPGGQGGHDGAGGQDGQAGGTAEYDRARIEAGVPDAVVDFALGDTFPHDANMDITGAVDFKKGCFVGQEVVSRMRHRGTARRRTVIVRSETALPETGTVLTVDGRDIGRLGTVAGRNGLAMVRIDRTSGTAMAGDVPVTLELPPRATFAFADPQGAQRGADA